VATVGIRALQRNPSKVIDEVERTGKPMFITRRGRLAAVILPLSEDAPEDYVLSHAPEFVSSRQEADEDLRAGRTRSLHSVLAELQDQHAR
jgi:prevent-host-death family protein